MKEVTHKDWEKMMGKEKAQTDEAEVPGKKGI